VRVDFDLSYVENPGTVAVTLHPASLLMSGFSAIPVVR
jgi:hypothetical protein